MPRNPHRILVVEDDAANQLLLKNVMGTAGYNVQVADNGQAFRDAFDREAPDLCILDLNLPDTDGITLLKEVKEKSPATPAIMFTGSDVIGHAVQAMQAGAYNYLSKPLESNQRLLVEVDRALKDAAQRREITALRVQLGDVASLEGIIGASARMRDAKAQAKKFLASEASVLVTGESGTGKELFARALHYGGARAKGPFIDVNCAALTESILESEIFGHEKGAFTGALARHIGKFEQADGGTIFLDEIGDMPLGTQAKLLRVLQERVFQRVGGSEKVSVNVRVISATNKDLEKESAEGRFRQDLYYRINTVTLEIPPLRDRREDIPELAAHFLQLAARRERRPAPEIGADAMKALREHRWPGNVRELENCVTRALVLSDSKIEVAHLPRAVTSAGSAAAAAVASPVAGLEASVEQLERTMIRAALDRTGWVKARAARDLGITERVLAYKMDTYALRRDEA